MSKLRYFSKPTQKQFLEIQKSVKQMEQGQAYFNNYRFGEFVIELRVART